MTRKQVAELIDLMRWNAARFRLPAHPNAWPDWMTADKRLEMADSWESIANDLAARQLP